MGPKLTCGALNSIAVTPADMLTIVRAIEKWSRSHPDDDLIVAIPGEVERLFGRNEKSNAVGARITALVRLIEDGFVVSWAMPKQPDGSQPLNTGLLEIAAKVCLRTGDEGFRFNPVAFDRYAGYR